MRKLAWRVQWFVLLLLGCMASAQSTSTFRQQALDCNDQSGILCAEVCDSIGYGGAYTGHDEPSVLFYSGVPGSGNTGVYFLRLPKDPPTAPKQDGSGGTFNFQLHPAFWVGMALCDDQSAPNPGGSPGRPNIPCKADSDSNIYDDSDPTSSRYIGNHPGSGFMEMQFFPPGWFPSISCDNTNRWCSALLTFGVSQNSNTGNNGGCGGAEWANFAFVTKSGAPGGPPSPLLQNGATFTPTTDTLFYNPGDLLRIDLRDTEHGLKITITDLTTGERGSMTASAANGYASLNFEPTGATCTQTFNDSHPMYATSSEHTRVPWAAHSYNIAFSDEIGHFEYCDAVDNNGNCTKPGVNDSGGVDADDTFCFPASASSRIKIAGCANSDVDFDDESYQLVWPGSLVSPGQDKKYHPSAVLFSSPLFTPTMGSGTGNYDRVAFETDLPRIEDQTSPPCNRSTGASCVNPPVGASFYPIYSTRNWKGSCVWQLGGANLPETKDDFGGNSTAEYGSLLPLTYLAFGGGGSTVQRYNDFRQVLPSNPCPQDSRLLKS